jgi:GNAT superfamily N-acetyltransferase
MIELRRAETAADIEAWRRVRTAVLPNERTPSVDEMRQTQTPDKLLLLAELDGELVGSGVAGRSDLGEGLGFVAPRVLPDARRRGVGSALLGAVGFHLAGLGFTEATALVDDQGSLAFAERFGFREVGRQVEQVRTIRPDEPGPERPEGVELVSLAERPDLFRRTYEELALQVFEDIPTPTRITISAEDWERDWITWPEGSLVALAEGEIVGCAGLLRDVDRPDRAENSLTAVRRDWRGRGLATALKQSVIAWAAGNGLLEIYTWTQNGNEAMQRLNEKLGYRSRMISITVRGPIPTVR